MGITWGQALSWRLGRQLLEPVGEGSVADVVRRLGAVLAMDASAAELAVGARRAASAPGDVARAAEDGEVVTVFAFRGATHHVSPEDGGAYLALRAAGRQWELPSWQEFYDLAPEDWPPFRAAVREALSDGPLTVGELGAAVAATPAHRHLGPVFDDGAGTLLKPLSWQGDLGLGPRRDGRLTLRRLDDAPGWAGVWDLEEAGPYAIRAYLGAYGPATAANIDHWLGQGLSAGARRLRGWLAGLGDDLVEVDVEGEPRLVLREHLHGLLAARPTDAVRLLPGHDQWVMGPGSAEQHVVPPRRRTAVTRKANLVLAAGVVSGTWVVTREEARITWFAERGSPPRSALADEVARLSAHLGRPLDAAVDLA